MSLGGMVRSPTETSCTKVPDQIEGRSVNGEGGWSVT